MRTPTLLLALSALATANERKFGYTYETSTMPVGQRELEIWNTARGGGDRFTSSLDQRVEVEVGVAPSTQASLYLNSSSSKDREGSSDGKGVSLEVKHQWTDPAADALGSAWYLEAGFQTEELELEGKILLDKQMGPWTVATNLVAETEWVWTTPQSASSTLDLEGIPLEATLATAYSFTPRFSLGIEARWTGETQRQTISDKTNWEFQNHAFQAGPTLSFGQEGYWAALTAMPRLWGIDEESQAIEIRLLAGFHF